MSHAHAWTLFYLNGTWQNLDTTPSDWVEIEKPQYFFSTYVGDMFSYLGFKLSRFFGREKDSRLQRYAMGLLAVLIFIILIKIFKNKKIAPGKKTAAPKMAISINPASDSEIYLIEKRFNQLGFSRRPWETFSEWFSEITQSNPNIIHKQFCETTIRLHRRYRFDPKGITVAEKDLLIQTVHKWLQHLNSGIGVNP